MYLGSNTKNAHPQKAERLVTLLGVLALLAAFVGDDVWRRMTPGITCQKCKCPVLRLGLHTGAGGNSVGNTFS